MSRLFGTRLTSSLVLLVGLVTITLGACGSDTGSMTFRLTNGTCFGCADPIYTVTILRPAGSSLCKLAQSKSTSKQPTLDALPLKDDEAATVVVALSCPADPNCAVCYAEKEIQATHGATYDLELTTTGFCVVPALANPLLANCPGVP